MPATLKPPIDMQTLEAIDVRVGTIVRVEDVAGARSLVRLRVDLGDHERTVLAGLKGERVDPSELEGMQALFVVNLEPREMMGEVSEGMLFDIGYADGITPVLAIPEMPVPPGTQVG
jgi:methionine--tRNA ligase beta chain